MATTYELIASQTLGSAAASITFSSIPGTFTDLVIAASLRNTVGNAGLAVRFNGDTGANYTWRLLRGNGSAAASINQTAASGYNSYLFAYIQGSEATANVFGVTHLYIPNYAGSTNKSASIESTGENNGTASYISATAGLWSNTAAITSVTLLPDPGGTSSNLAADSSAFLYGITKA